MHTRITTHDLTITNPEQAVPDLELGNVAQGFLWTGTLKVVVKDRQRSVTFAGPCEPQKRQKVAPPKPNETDLLLGQIRALTTRLTYLGEKMRKDQHTELVPSRWRETIDTDDTSD